MLLAATLWLHTTADRIGASAAVNVPPDSKQEAIALLSRMLGDGPSTRELAEAAIMLDTMPGDPGSAPIRLEDGNQTQWVATWVLRHDLVSGGAFVER